MNYRVRRMVGPIVFVLLCGIIPVRAQTLSPDIYAPALSMFAGGLIEVRSYMEQCPLEAFAPAVAPDDWEAARAKLVASLWANGMAADGVRRIEDLLARRISNMDCAGTETIKRHIVIMREQGWTYWVDNALESLRMAPVENPATPEQWQRIKALFAEERAAQARLLECMSVIDPILTPSIVGEWTNTVVRTGQMLVQAGLPRDEIVVEIEASDTARLWTPVFDAKERAALLGPCMDDEVWQERWASFAQGRLRYETESILGVTP